MHKLPCLVLIGMCFVAPAHGQGSADLRPRFNEALRLLNGDPAPGIDVAPKVSGDLQSAKIMVRAEDPQSVVIGLQNYGVAAILGMDTQGYPSIATRIAGLDSTVFFFNCDHSFGNCRSIAFSTGFILSRKMTLEMLNDWNARRMFGFSYLDPRGDPYLRMDMNLSGGGVGLQNFVETVQRYDSALAEFKAYAQLFARGGGSALATR